VLRWAVEHHCPGAEVYEVDGIDEVKHRVSTTAQAPSDTNRFYY